MAIYTGEVHSTALGLGNVEDLPEEMLLVKGVYDEQDVRLNTDSKSMLELAYEMDDCPSDSRIIRGHNSLIERDIKDKKKAEKRQKVAAFYVGRLDPHRGTGQYTDYERKLHRLKQRIMMQNQRLASGGGEKNLTFDGEDLAEYILRDISLDFYEVTDQDNVLEYLQAMEDLELDYNKSELLQCRKMLQRLSGRTDENSQRRIEEFTAKVKTLGEQIRFSPSFAQALHDARSKLEKFHGAEIEIGYNLIPEAAKLMPGMFGAGGREPSAIDIVAVYRDKILCCTNFLEVFSIVVSICTSTWKNAATQLLGQGASTAVG
ncbi:MAG: hypothetical protein LBI61_00785 [Puniceicoccales bacterium]|jgi:hypothetical protein|nr:hypothetical protein [Puniceicoccales bacterium]